MRNGGFSWSIKSKGSKNIIFVLFSSILRTINSSFYSLLIGEILSRLFVPIRKKFSLNRLLRLKFYKSLFRTIYLHSFAIVTVPSWFITNLFILSIPLIINILYNPTQVSYYTFKSRIIFGGEIILAGYINHRLIDKFL